MSTDLGQMLIFCWSCSGTGREPFTLGGETFPCPRCKGSGSCPAIMRVWEAAGKKAQQWRHHRLLSLEDAAAKLGTTPGRLAESEKGIVDPESLGHIANIF